MFDYRCHALSLAAVLLALAVGIVIGVAIGDSNLVSSAKSGIVRDLSAEVGAAQRQTGQLRAQLSAEEAFANDLYPIAVHGLLRGRSIGLLFLGNASDQIDGGWFSWCFVVVPAPTTHTTYRRISGGIGP